MIGDPYVWVSCDGCDEECDAEMPISYGGPMHTTPAWSLRGIAKDPALKGWSLDFDTGEARCPDCRRDPHILTN